MSVVVGVHDVVRSKVGSEVDKCPGMSNVCGGGSMLHSCLCSVSEVEGWDVECRVVSVPGW